MKNLLFLKITLVTILAVLTPLTLSLFFTGGFLLTLLSGILAILAGSTLIFLFLKPIKNLVQAAQSLGAGNLNQRVDIRSKDEFEEIGQSFNTFADNIKKNFENIEQQKDMAISERSKLEEILSTLVDGIVALDFNKNIILVNKAAEEITGYKTGELINRPISELIHLYSDQEEILPKTYCSAIFNQAVKLIGKDGRENRVNLSTAQISGQIQTNLSCMLLLHDLSKEEDLERMKFDFVSMASHELRTPLTSIIGYLSVFEGENRGKLPKEEMELIGRSLISAKGLLMLVQNLLSVNKIERDEVSVSKEAIDYLPILSKAVEALRNLANQKNILLTLNSPPEALPKVMADPIRVEEVVINLLANAINYTNPGGKVAVILHVSPNEVTTTVSDSGVGIPKEAIPHLFNKFFRVSNQDQKMSKGTGLGLYISKSIVEKLGGKIWVESEAGKGSNFSFTLPVLTISSGLVNTDRAVSSQIQSGALNY